MSELVAGARVRCVFPDGTEVTGVLVAAGAAGTLDIQFDAGGISLLFLNADGSLRPRWAGAAVEVLSPPRPPEPMLPGAIVLAGHPEMTGRSLFVRLYTGRWRALGGGNAVWAELVEPVVRFEGTSAQ